jgi:hypothetical protein
VGLADPGSRRFFPDPSTAYEDHGAEGGRSGRVPAEKHEHVYSEAARHDASRAGANEHPDRGHGAERLHDHLGAAAVDSVLVAVDLQRRDVDIVTGPEARMRRADRSCKLAVMSIVASFKEGDLIGGVLSGLRTLSDQAGIPHHGSH